MGLLNGALKWGWGPCRNAPTDADTLSAASEGFLVGADFACAARGFRAAKRGGISKGARGVGQGQSASVDRVAPSYPVCSSAGIFWPDEGTQGAANAHCRLGGHARSARTQAQRRGFPQVQARGAQ